MDSTDPRTTWNTGYSLLLVVPFLGMLLTFTDPPRWLQIIGVLVMLTLVGVASSMMRRRPGGWRPSEDVKGVNGVKGVDGSHAGER
ncbi:MAG: hypothetical protein ABI249_01365 [Ornithinibacter sp.]